MLTTNRLHRHKIHSINLAKSTKWLTKWPGVYFWASLNIPWRSIHHISLSPYYGAVVANSYCETTCFQCDDFSLKLENMLHCNISIHVHRLKFVFQCKYAWRQCLQKHRHENYEHGFKWAKAFEPLRIDRQNLQAWNMFTSSVALLFSSFYTFEDFMV